LLQSTHAEHEAPRRHRLLPGSTNKQGKSGLGLAHQKFKVAEFCEQRALKLEGTFTEVEPGKNDARPQLALALAAARRRGGILVVATLSRLGRLVAFVSTLMEQGVPFAAADAPDDEPFILHVKAAFAEEEARKISTRTKAALAVAKAQGAKLGRLENLTHDARRKGAATNAARAAAEHDAIRPQVAELRAAGLSLRGIGERVGVSTMYVSRSLRA
jgi:DNA invertase Pin-like site-specific DNA recombinase